MWSVGCIFAELMLRRPFFPGDNYIDQLTIICDKLGKPKEEELTFVSTEKARPVFSLQSLAFSLLRFLVLSPLCDTLSSSRENTMNHNLGLVLRFAWGLTPPAVRKFTVPFVPPTETKAQD